MSHDSRIARARLSLEGLACGDAFGLRFFLPEATAVSLVHQRSLPAPPWFFSDDTMMALSIVSTLEKYSKIDQDYLAASFARHYDPSRAYGAAMHEFLVKIRSKPASWRQEAQALFGGQGSFGNGSAMRIAPLGAYFADDLDAVISQAELSAVITHYHAEAIAGAIAIALAAAIAWQCKQSAQLPCARDFLDQIYQRTPNSAVRRGLQKALDLSDNVSPQIAAATLGNGSRISAPDTVPFCVWTAAHYLDRYEEALWTTVSVLGDRDTTCAIVGGIVVMYSGLESIPNEWLENREPLPVRFDD